MADRTGLENRRHRKMTEGSNPSPSVKRPCNFKKNFTFRNDRAPSPLAKGRTTQGRDPGMAGTDYTSESTPGSGTSIRRDDIS